MITIRRGIKNAKKRLCIASDSCHLADIHFKTVKQTFPFLIMK